MPTMPTLPSNPTALRQQLIQHYNAYPEVVPVPPATQSQPPVVQAVRVPSPPRQPSQRTIEGVAEENRKVVATYQGNLNSELDYINSVWTPGYSDGYYWIPKNATDHLPGWGYGGYIPSYDKWMYNKWMYNRHPVNQGEFNSMVSVVKNLKEGIRNNHQNAIDAANSKAQAEIKELQRSRLSVSVSPVISVNPSVPRSVSSLRRIGFPRTGSSAPIPVPQGIS